MPKNSSWIDIRQLSALPDDCALVSEQERIEAGRMTSPRRRNEWLLWRAVVREHLGADTVIDYDSVGAPVLCNRNGHISVSHCMHEVAVMYSPDRCAIDVESLSRDFSGISRRYLNDVELGIVSSFGQDGLAAAWCVKEAVYKYIGRPQAGLLRDIAITGCAPGQGTVTVDTPWTERLQVTVRFRPYTAVAVIGIDPEAVLQ